MKRLQSCAAALLMLAGVAAAHPALAQRKMVTTIVPDPYLKAWAQNEWHIWAMPDGSCLVLAQEPETTPLKFWGFRQSPGSRIDIIFTSTEPLRPRTLQMSFNDGGKFDYDARVVHYAEYDAYAISVQANALSIFHDQTIIESFVRGQKIFWGVTNSMRNVEIKMRKCLEWQTAH